MNRQIQMRIAGRSLVFHTADALRNAVVAMSGHDPARAH